MNDLVRRPPKQGGAISTGYNTPMQRAPALPVVAPREFCGNISQLHKHQLPPLRHYHLALSGG
jgi:hypothetical protein